MKAVDTGEGANCPKCLKAMRRRVHKAEWQPKPNQPYYFSFWDYCVRCAHVQLYEVAKVYVKREETELEQRVIEQLRPAYETSGDRPPWED